MIKKGQVKLLYKNKDITRDISAYLMCFRYTDNAEGTADEISLKLADPQLLWVNEWYPEKGAELKPSFGYSGQLKELDKFTIDEISFTLNPFTIEIKAIAAAITKKIRTKNVKAFSKTTLRDIAQYIAQKHSLKIQGTVPSIDFVRVNQYRKTDLEFLNEISRDYGVMFSIVGDNLVFTDIYSIEAKNPVTEIDITDCIDGNLKDKTSESFQAAVVRHHNPSTKEVVEYKIEQRTNQDGIDYTVPVAVDTKIIRTKTESAQQAEAKAKAALHIANSRQQSGSLTMPGNPLLVAGNNFDLTGCGQLSGKYNIESSDHDFDPTSGYISTVTIKKVGFITKSRAKPKKKRKTNYVYKTTT